MGDGGWGGGEEMGLFWMGGVGEDGIRRGEGGGEIGDIYREFKNLGVVGGGEGLVGVGCVRMILSIA